MYITQLWIYPESAEIRISAMYLKHLTECSFQSIYSTVHEFFNDDNHLSYWSTVCKPEVYLLLLNIESLDNAILELWLA